jgi:hypothetical protein
MNVKREARDWSEERAPAHWRPWVRDLVSHGRVAAAATHPMWSIAFTMATSKAGMSTSNGMFTVGPRQLSFRFTWRTGTGGTGPSNHRENEQTGGNELTVDSNAPLNGKATLAGTALVSVNVPVARPQV